MIVPDKCHPEGYTLNFRMTESLVESNLTAKAKVDDSDRVRFAQSLRAFFFIGILVAICQNDIHTGLERDGAKIFQVGSNLRDHLSFTLADVSRSTPPSNSNARTA
ncbi:MAG: hypothetical protein ISN28_14630 [Ectothiorhodospiraceae bacterium AqS1]|nr:hypothetical protein [Ectothiorhodospiraceae bacterium AqS1]